jgi:hypothetical protein
VESPNAKSSRMRGARLAVMKPGSTPATISAVPAISERRPSALPSASTASATPGAPAGAAARRSTIARESYRPP